MEQVKTSNSAAISKHPFIRGVERTIFAHGMLAANQSVLVGVSGGPDSVALLYVLLRLSAAYRWCLGVAHLNHGLRAQESDAEASFVKDLAKRLNLSYFYEIKDIHAMGMQKGINLEEAGRNARYDFFRKTAAKAGYDKIAVGHQQEDAAEQVLLNLLRGTGPTGLGGIDPLRGDVIRPLIETPRMEIERFLQDHKISYCTDQSNRDIRFTRNHVRNCLIPELQKYNPRIVETLCRLSKVMREESDWIDNVVAPVYEDAVIGRDAGGCELVLSVKHLYPLQTAAKRRIIRKAILEVKGDLRRIEYQHIDAVASMIEREAGGAVQIHLPGRILVMRNEDRLGFTRRKKSLRSFAASGKKWATVQFAHTLERIGKTPESVWIDEISTRFVFNPLSIHDIDYDYVFNRQEQAAWVDLDRIKFPVIIRNPRPGDRFVPLGMRGTMKIKDFFINNKVRPDKRGRIPVIESGGQIIWVVGMRIDERVKITPKTENVLKISFFSTGKDL
ncbi:MAG: tRNA lysidine(34) synthetase TilS [Desulfobacteraceae bacterium]|nr:tRNA lysidine(34) synthetase TilS [Desulfobacteraceae bacterium]